MTEKQTCSKYWLRSEHTVDRRRRDSYQVSPMYWLACPHHKSCLRNGFIPIEGNVVKESADAHTSASRAPLPLRCFP